MTDFQTAGLADFARLAQRFWSRVDTSAGLTGCWPWTDRLNRGGYGELGSGVLAHRLAYTLLMGPIPDGLHLDHLCRVRKCVNPSHLEPVTQRENNLRGMSGPAVYARRTHCHRGHPYDERNTRMYQGCRVCRRCSSINSLARYYGHGPRQNPPDGRGRRFDERGVRKEKPSKSTSLQRFWAKVDSSAGPEGCWGWTGHRDANGYSRCGGSSQGLTTNVHRRTYELMVGPIPKGLHLDHLCRNRACVNPAHLEPVTQRENILRGIRARNAAVVR